MPATIVIAPDSLKGTASAAEAAQALAVGWLHVRPKDDLRLLPMADGGEGTLEAFAMARAGAQHVAVTVTGPDDRDVDACWLRYVDDDGLLTGLVELASTSGITLLDQLRPSTAHTRGFGQAVDAALRAGVQRLVLAIGGSSSTDGGAGMLSALGARFLDRNGQPIRDGLQGLPDIVAADLHGLARPPVGGVQVLTDVTNPLLGSSGAVAVFGPQKGLDGQAASAAEVALRSYVGVVSYATGVDPGAVGAGAAGGTGFGLLAWGATLVPGAGAVSDQIGLPASVVAADLVVTGEGRYDEQSEQGKVASYVRGLARNADCRTALVAGLVSSDSVPFDTVVSLTELAGSTERAIAEPIEHLVRAGEVLAQSYDEGIIER